MHRHFRYMLILLSLVIAFSSCTSRNALRFEMLSDATAGNDFLKAVASIRKSPKLYGKNNLFLYHMDLGVLYHYAEMHDSSNSHLLAAEEIFNGLFARSVTNEAAALITNDNIRPYRSKPFELVMLHQFCATNFLARGQYESALVEARRVQLLFDELKRKNRSGVKYDSDGMFHYLSSIAYDAAGETSDAMISLYSSIKAYQEGTVSVPERLKREAACLFHLNDRDDDIRTLGLEECDAHASEGYENDATEIVVIGYAGRGPVLEEKSWAGTWIKDGLLVVNHTGPGGERETMTLPAPALPPEELKKAEKGKKTESGTTFHVKFALPSLRKIPSTTTDFVVRCDGQARSCTSVVINDLDLQAEKFLQDTRTATLARTVARVVLRTIAAKKAKEGIQTGNPAANLLLNIGTDLLSDQLEKADTRGCFLLPKTVHIARIPVAPGTHSLEVTARGRNGAAVSSKIFSDISLGANEKRFVYYSSFK